MKTMELRVTVNGRAQKWTIAPGDLLLDVLRREGFFGVKRGCEKGECGACTVLVNGRAINSCLMFAAKAEGSKIVTIEGVAEDGKLHPLQQAFLEHGAATFAFPAENVARGKMCMTASVRKSARAATSAFAMGNAARGKTCATASVRVVARPASRWVLTISAMRRGGTIAVPPVWRA